MFNKMKEVIITDYRAQMTKERFYELCMDKDTRIGVFLTGIDDEPYLQILRRFKSALHPTVAYISTKDPVLALKAFLDAADIVDKVELENIPKYCLEHDGKESYLRLILKAEEISVLKQIEFSAPLI